MAQSIKTDEPLALIRERFSFQEPDLREYSPLQFAFIGDAVFELLVRTIVFHEQKGQAGAMSIKTAGLVNAAAQSKLAKQLLPHLTEEEQAVFRRGRNAKPTSQPRHQSISDYHRATGLESLFGYLYLKGDWNRMLDLIQLGFGDSEEGA